MQIKKITLYICIFLSLLCIQAKSDIYIYFINGASNFSKSEIEKTSKNLVKVLKDGGVVSKEKLVYGAIPIIGGYTNYYEIKFQQKMSSNSMANTFEDLSGTLAADIYLQNLGDSYQSQFERPFPIFGVDNNVAANNAAQTVILKSHDISNIIINKIFNNDQVILISHSQGNLYVEGALAFLYKNYNNEIVRNNLKVINLASISALSYSNTWITLSQDQAVNGKKYGILIDDGIFKVTPKNEDACLQPCNKIAPLEDLKVGWRTDAHGINETYLNENVYSYEKKERISSLIVKYVNDSIDALETPIIFSVSPANADILNDVIFTVTGNNLVSGMGFAVNDCSPSSLELAGGTKTKRQYRCSSGRVPGEKNGVIKDRPGGNIIYEFKVNITAPPSDIWVTNIDASPLTLKQVFQGDLSSLPNGISIIPGEYRLNNNNGCSLKQPLEVHVYRNDKKFEISTIATTERTICSDGSAYTATKGYTETYSGYLEYGFIFLEPNSACSVSVNNICFNFETIKPER